MEGNRNQLARNISALADAGYRPVWSREYRYPGTIPDDIAEFLDSNSYRKLTYIASKARGLFY